MKNNTNTSKELLKRALTNMPNDFSLNEVKNLIKNAIFKIESVEKKRDKREENIKQNQIDLDKWKQASFNQQVNSLQAIEEMIKAEQEKLDKNKNRKKDTDDDGIQTILD